MIFKKNLKSSLILFETYSWSLVIVWTIIIYALKKFEQEAQEIFEFTDIDAKPYFRLMSPMIAKKECLKCHGHQGYKVGDVRGGVSGSVPMAPYLANQKRQTIVYVISGVRLLILIKPQNREGYSKNSCFHAPIV